MSYGGKLNFLLGMKKLFPDFEKPVDFKKVWKET